MLNFWLKRLFWLCSSLSFSSFSADLAVARAGWRISTPAFPSGRTASTLLKGWPDYKNNAKLVHFSTFITKEVLKNLLHFKIFSILKLQLELHYKF